MDRHLDEAALQALEAKDPQVVAHFRDHLARPCAECEAFLATAPARLWWLEAEADRLLLLHGAAPAQAVDVSGYAAVRRSPRARRLRRALGAAAAAAAAIAAGVWAVVVPLRPQEPAPAYASVKGPEESGLLELSAVVVSSSGVAAPIGPGGRAKESDTLVLRYRAARGGPAFLVKSGPGGTLQALGELALFPGTHDLADPGGVAGVSLEGERGEVRLWLVQSDAPLTAAGAVEAVRRSAPERGVWVAGFSIRVGSGEN